MAKNEINGISDQGEVSRRRLLGGVTIGGALALLVAAPQPAAAKMTEAAANYQNSPKGEASCSNCTLFRAPSSCLIVDGTISPNGWCRFYAKKG